MASEKNKKETKPASKEERIKSNKEKGLDENGKFAKGRAKTGGRKLGTPNRAGNVRDRLKEQVEPFIDSISEMLVRVQKEEGTKEMMYLMEKFMPYFMPKFSSLSIGADQDRPIDEEQMLLKQDAKYTKKELSINFKTMTVVNNGAAGGDFDPDEDPDFDLSQFDDIDTE